MRGVYMNKKIQDNKLLRILSNLDIWVAGIIMLALLILTFVNVLMRYVARSPITWADELQLFMFLWIVYLAAGAGFRNGSHVVIEILVDSLPAKAKRFFEILAFILSMIIVIYLMIQSNASYMQLIHTNKIATLLRVSFKWVYLCIPIGNVLMVVSLVIYYYRELFGKKEAEQEVSA